MLKKSILVLVFVLSLHQHASAAGAYDGVWHAPLIGGFSSLHEQNGLVVMVMLSPDMVWEAWMGSLNGNRASVDLIGSDVSSHIEIEFTSATSGEFYQTSCQPITSTSCALPNNVTYHFNKIW